MNVHTLFLRPLSLSVEHPELLAVNREGDSVCVSSWIQERPSRRWSFHSEQKLYLLLLVGIHDDS